MRAGRSDIDRVLVSSSAKPILACEALAAELEARAGRAAGGRARATASGRRPGRTGSPLELGGGGRGLRAAIAGDQRLAITRPLLITGTTFACAAADAAGARGGAVAPAASRLGRAGDRAASWSSCTGVDRPVQAGVGLLRDGWTRCIVGTRGLLGEGWDAPSVNCLVDVTTVAASISTRQMRGRSLRLDPADPEKMASNWDIVCVAPELERGVADYRRFVRRHAHLLAPCEDGSIESGVSHVHPELGPYAPPPAEDFAALNAGGARARRATATPARERWRIGEPYRAVELPALLVRSAAIVGARCPRTSISAACARRRGRAGGCCRPPAAAVSRPCCRSSGPRARSPTRCDALGELSDEAHASLAWQPRAGGYVRCLLPAGGESENAVFVAALEDAVSPAGDHRYVVSRPLGGGRWPRYGTAWHPVPADLGRNRERADAYRAAFTRWLGPGELRYTPASEAGREALAQAAGAAETLEAQRRRLWL